MLDKWTFFLLSVKISSTCFPFVLLSSRLIFQSTISLQSSHSSTFPVVVTIGEWCSSLQLVHKALHHGVSACIFPSSSTIPSWLAFCISHPHSKSYRIAEHPSKRSSPILGHNLHLFILLPEHCLHFLSLPRHSYLLPAPSPSLPMALPSPYF